MMNFKKARLGVITWVLITLLCAFQPVMASGLEATVGATKIGLGDTFDLTLSLDAADATAAPDLAPLKKNFRILDVGQSSQVSIVNGRRSDSYSWVITLAPNKKGKLTIPGIRAGNRTSRPITIDVVDAAELPASLHGAGEFTIEITPDPGTHYVMEEIPLTVRIEGGGDIRQASLEVPTGNDFVLTQSGEDQVGRSTHNGRPTTVIERHYLLKPQKSGSLTVPPLTLQAMVSDPAGGRSSVFPDMGFADRMLQMPFNSSLFDDVFNPGHRVIVSSQPLQLEVKPRPTGDEVWFLPARQVELESEWTPSQPKFRVGEAVTRKIRLFALGASGEQLPDIPVADIDGARVYLNRSNDDTGETSEGTVSIREFDLSIVPTRSGKITLPAIEVPWWDTGSDQEQVAVLPAQAIEVVPAAGRTAQNGTDPVADTEVTTATAKNSTPAPEDKVGSLVVQRAPAYGLYALVATAALVLALLLFLRKRQHPSETPGVIASLARRSDHNLDSASERERIERALVRACKANDLPRAYAALSNWMSLDSSQRDAVSPGLAAEREAMEKQLYSGAGDMAWRGKALLELFSQARRSRRASARPGSDRHDLPALYPG